MPLIDTHRLPVREPKPGWHGRFFDSNGMSFAYYELDAGAALHEHSHPNEEVWNVIAGQLEITIGGDTFGAEPGTVAVVPPNTAHSVRAIRKSTVIVVDQPRRGPVGGTGRAALAVELATPPDTGTPLRLTLRNQGSTPGVVHQIELESGVAAVLHPPRRPDVPLGALPQHIEVAGGASHDVTQDAPPLTAAQREEVRDGRAVFYVRGAVFYDDNEGERHHTTFCRVYQDGGLIPPESPGYNYGD